MADEKTTPDGKPGNEKAEGTPSSDEKTLTQADFNRAIDKRQKSIKAEMKIHTDNLAIMKKDSKKTESEKAELQKRIDQIDNEMLTEKEKMEQQKQAGIQEWKTKCNDEKAEKEKWKKEYENEVIHTTIVTAAVKSRDPKNKDLIYFDPIKAHRLLKDDCFMQEITNPDTGNPTGKFKPVINMMMKEKNSDEMVMTTLDLNDGVREYLKQNLDLAASNFKGGSGTEFKQTESKRDLKDMTTDEKMTAGIEGFKSKN